MMGNISKVFALILTGVAFSAGSCGAQLGDSNDSTSDSGNVSIVDINEEESSELNPDSGENPICDSIMSLDGPGEETFLWKPESESDGKAVVLFPTSFVSRFIKVTVVNIDGDVEEGVYSNFTNGDRQTWRFSKEGQEYQPRVTAYEATQECVWVFPDSSVRQD